VSIKFFGQFLIERGEIDAGNLCEALAYMEKKNLTLGEIAVREKLISRTQAQKINDKQRELDRPFGALAVELGMLDQAKLDGLVKLQQEERVPIGSALVQLGFLATDRLGPLLDAYKADQAAYQAGVASLPPELAQLRSAHIAVDFLPKFCMRMARLRVKVGDHRPVRDARRLPHRASVSFSGDEGLELALACDGEFARPLAAAACLLDVATLQEELIDDGIGEFLNVLAGNALSALEREKVRVQLAPPRLGVAIDSGTEIDLAVEAGLAYLVLRRA
jgi:hypothetical protein